MLSKSILLAALAAVSSVHAQEYLGFNYGSTKVDGSAKDQAYFQQEFAAAKKLAGQAGKFTSARIYTMIQGGSANDPISAIPAAIEEGTSLLLGIWASAGQEVVTNEITALTRAIEQYGEDFTKLVVGLSVGSEDLYRNSVMGIEAKAGLGGNPDDLVKYINQVKKAISGTSMKGVPIGHVDTWTAWVNGTNSAVIDAVDWLGFDAYPYFQSTMANSIEVSSDLFWQAYDNTQAASKGKEVWITETGWPIGGKDMNLAKADVPSAQSYWNQVGCALFGKHKTWWYILEDVGATPEFGVIGSDGKPYYDLSCKNAVIPNRSSTSSAGPSTTAGSQTSAGTTFAVQTSSGAASTKTSVQSSAGAAATSGSSNTNSSAAISLNPGSAMTLVAFQVITVIGAMLATAVFTL